MSKVKRMLLIFLCLAVTAILLRGGAFRQLVAYKATGNRTSYGVTDEKLIANLEEQLEGSKKIDAEQIAMLGLSVTSATLNFTISKNDNDPNKLIHSKTAHCVGYAAFYAASCNYLFQKAGLAGSWVARPRVGQLHVLGFNIHQLFSSPFLKDHDFVVIENKRSGAVFAVDPSLHDYFSINTVALQQ